MAKGCAFLTWGLMSNRVAPPTFHDDVFSVVSCTQATGSKSVEVLDSSSFFEVLDARSFRHMADKGSEVVPAGLAKLLTPTGHGGEDGKVLLRKHGHGHAIYWPAALVDCCEPNQASMHWPSNQKSGRWLVGALLASIC